MTTPSSHEVTHLLLSWRDGYVHHGASFGFGLVVYATNYTVENNEVNVLCDDGVPQQNTTHGMGMVFTVPRNQKGPGGPGKIIGNKCANTGRDAIFIQSQQRVAVLANSVYGPNDDGISIHSGTPGFSSSLLHTTFTATTASDPDAGAGSQVVDHWKGLLMQTANFQSATVLGNDADGNFTLDAWTPTTPNSGDRFYINYAQCEYISDNDIHNTASRGILLEGGFQLVCANNNIQGTFGAAVQVMCNGVSGVASMGLSNSVIGPNNCYGWGDQTLRSALTSVAAP